MKLDYIVVGLGLAGLAFVEELIEAKKTFMVFEDDSQTSSLVAGGVYNPVILKRFSPVWNAKEQLEIALPFYEKLEKKFNIKIDEKFVIKKVFKSIRDQNNWFSAFDKPTVAPFLDSILDTKDYPGILADFSYGNVKEGGRIDTLKLVESYREYLKKNNLIRFIKFNHKDILLKENSLEYKDLEANKIVFSEGFGLKENPFFNYLPLQGSKGEYVFIEAPDLKEDKAIKSSVFIIPQGNNIYRVGANYERHDKTNLPTESAKEGLLAKLRTVLKCDFKVVDQVAGVRPTVVDRKPLVGRHPKFKSLHILNGFGSRGVLIGPSAAKQLYMFAEDGQELNPELDIARFTQKYFQ